MARRAAWVVFATVAAVVLGCTPAKELPDEVAPPTEAGEKAVAVPAASEPKAKEYVEKAVKAFTAGKPELVPKGKVSRAMLKGRLIRQDVGETETVRTIAAVWSDRLAVTDDSRARGLRDVLTAHYHRPHFAVIQQGREVVEIPNRAELSRILVADQTAQHWMPLFVPLTDPKAVVFDLQAATVTLPQTGKSQAVNHVKLAIPDQPLYLLAFDTQSDVLLRVEYTLTEQGVRRKKLWSALGHAPGPDGQMLPNKTDVRHDNTIVEEWEVEKWEFPASIPDAEFSPPRK